eukprot:g4324.t1
MSRLRRIRAEISEHDSVQRYSTEVGVDVISSRARFASRREVVLEDGSKLQFRKCILGTGAAARIPKVLEGIPHLTNSNLWNLRALPPSLRPSVQWQFVSSKIQTITCSSNSESELYDEPFVTYRLKLVDDVVLDASALLNATGRVARTAGLDLEKAGIHGSAELEVNEWTPSSITGVWPVRTRLQTSNEDVFAAGDCLPGAQRFTHAAEWQARVAVRNALLDERMDARRLLVPRATYTDPEVASVGSSAQELRDAGKDFTTFMRQAGDVDRNVCDGVSGGYASLHVAPDGEILGATVVGRNAGDHISEVTLCMQHGLTAAELAGTMHPYPTAAEVVRQAAQAFVRSRIFDAQNQETLKRNSEACDWVRSEWKNGLHIISLDRPKALNACNQAMAKCIAEAAARPASAVLLRGDGGRAFCAGGDVKGVALAIQADPQSSAEDVLELLQREAIPVESSGRPDIERILEEVFVPSSTAREAFRRLTRLYAEEEEEETQSWEGMGEGNCLCQEVIMRLLEMAEFSAKAGKTRHARLTLDERFRLRSQSEVMVVGGKVGRGTKDEAALAKVPHAMQPPERRSLHGVCLWLLLALSGGTDVENVCEKGFYQEDCDYRPVMDKSEVAHGRIVHRQDPIVFGCQGGKGRQSMILTSRAAAQGQFSWEVPKDTADLSVEVLFEPLKSLHGSAKLSAKCADTGEVILGETQSLLNESAKLVTAHGAQWSWSGNATHRSGSFSLWLRVHGPLHCDLGFRVENDLESNLAADDFRLPTRLPKSERPEPEVDLEQLGVPLEVKLPPALQAAAEETGYTKGVRKIQKAVVKMQASKRDDHLKEKPPPMGSVHFDEQLLRKLFQKMDRFLHRHDLDHCEAISSKVLRHLFLQMGREIAAEELEAMITMVDMKEMGTATYEDFAAIFGNPAESLRQVNVEAVQAAARGEVRRDRNCWRGC